MNIEARKVTCRCGDAHLCTADPISDATDHWIDQANVGQGWTSRGLTYVAYLNWCADRGVTPLGQRRLFATLRFRGVREWKRSGSWGFGMTP